MCRSYYFGWNMWYGGYWKWIKLVSATMGCNNTFLISKIYSVFKIKLLVLIYLENYPEQEEIALVILRTNKSKFLVKYIIDCIFVI